MWFGGPFRSVDELPVADGYLEVQSVRRGSVAARAGVQAGDRLLAINGKPVYEYSTSRLMRRLTDRRLERAKVDRDGEVFRVYFR